MRAVVLGLTASLLAIAACSTSNKSSDVVPTDVDAGEADAGTTSRYSFSPLTADRTCTADADCVILQAIRNCSRCCGHGAVARGEAQQAYADAAAACKEPGAPRSTVCEEGCAAGGAACFEGTCVMLGSGGTEPVCRSDAGAPGAIPELGPGPSCGAQAVRAGFEDGLDPAWTSTDPAAFTVDRSAPISGGASLRMAYRQKDATLVIPQPEACAVRLALTMRTRLTGGSVTLARIVAGDGSWLHVRLDACRLSVAEEIRSGGAASLGWGAANWTLPGDTPVRVVITVDLRGRTISSAAAPLGTPLPTPTSAPLRADASVATGIRAIELGSAPGIENSAVGSVWIDDLVID